MHTHTIRMRETKNLRDKIAPMCQQYVIISWLNALPIFFDNTHTDILKMHTHAHAHTHVRMHACAHTHTHARNRHTDT